MAKDVVVVTLPAGVTMKEREKSRVARGLAEAVITERGDACKMRVAVRFETQPA